ncbi:MAG: hypothetical protein ACR2MT_09925 [Aurantibacter sp.]
MDVTRFLESNFDAGLGELDGKDSVIIYFGTFAGLDEIHRLDTRLYEEIPLAIGRHDGHEVAIDDTHGTLFSYGENAETLFKAMQPILNEFDFLEGATVQLCFINNREKPLDLEFKLERTNNLIKDNE